MIKVQCPCGDLFETWPYKIKQGRGKFCSKDCMYKFRRARPFGLNYNVTTNKGWFKKGILPHNKGNPCSQKTRDKISRKLKGRRCSPRTEFKKGQMTGSNNPNWKGGITPENLRIRASEKYKQWRKSVFERDNYTCQFCSQYGGILNADHIKPFALFLGLRFDLDNGRTLCIECHRKTPTYGRKSK